MLLSSAKRHRNYFGTTRQTAPTVVHDFCGMLSNLMPRHTSHLEVCTSNWRVVLPETSPLIAHPSKLRKDATSRESPGAPREILAWMERGE